MLKRKLSTLILATTIANMTAAPINVFAETLSKNNTVQTNELSEKNETKKAIVSKFSLHGSELLQSYNKVYKHILYHFVFYKYLIHLACTSCEHL